MLGQRTGHCGDREEERKACRARPPLTFDSSVGDPVKEIRKGKCISFDFSEVSLLQRGEQGAYLGWINYLMSILRGLLTDVKWKDESVGLISIREEPY